MSDKQRLKEELFLKPFSGTCQRFRYNEEDHYFLDLIFTNLHEHQYSYILFHSLVCII